MADQQTMLRDQLMQSNGTTPYETISVIVPTAFYATVTTIIVSLLQARTINQPFQFCVEFITLVIPIILNITVLADYSTQVLTTSCVICLSLMLWLRTLKPSISKPTTPLNRDYITNTRSTINIISVIAILAVDFLIFPRRFVKTEKFGYSLMDVGVGLFMFSNGMVDGGQANLPKSLKGSIPLFILGTFRLLVTRQINYHVLVSEYGIHWNFFITLGVTKIFVSLLFSVIHVRFIWINATLLMISHEILLQTGLENFAMSNTKRTDFITANKEGLVSSVGYVYLYLYTAYFTYLLDLKKGGKTTAAKFAGSAVLTLVLSVIFERNFGISRKLANPAYCFWVLFIGIFMTGLYYIVGKVLEDVLWNKLRVPVHLPLIFQAINYNGLGFFLLSNLLTGLVNILCDTLKVGTIFSLIVITIYMLTNCCFVCILYKKQIKLKL